MRRRNGVRIFFKYYLLILSGVSFSLGIAILCLTPDGLGLTKRSVAVTFVQGFLKGHPPTGVYTGRRNRLDFSRLEPGDILLAGKPQAAYGHFTHAGLYLGQGDVLEGYVDCGLSRQPVTHYHSYDWACILRVELPPLERARVLEFATAQEFKPFYPAAFKPGQRYWNCTKIIWTAYQQVGLDLDPNVDLWVSPDALYFSPWVHVITAEGDLPLWKGEMPLCPVPIGCAGGSGS